MLLNRLKPIGVVVLSTLLSPACGSVDEVIEPVITAVAQSRTLACDADAQALQMALDAFELLYGVPAPDESALVIGELLRSESAHWDVLDGELVAQDPACGESGG